jgi:endonuclease/exonuclease/phosphatase family metal-dependent hydrolase
MMGTDKLDTTHSLNLVTLNIFGVPFMQDTRARLATIARELDSHALDVICLQEVQLFTYVPLLDEAFSKFPFKAYERFIYAPKGGLLTFSRRRLERTDFILYPERGWWHTPSLADRLLHKGILLIELRYADQHVIILNTHLTANYNGDWSPVNRYARLAHAQLRQLAEVVNQLNPASIVIIAGDFNLPRHSWLYDDFMARTGVIDPLAGDLTPTYYPIVSLPDRYQQAIDYTFVRIPPNCPVKVRAKLVFTQEVTLTSGSSGRVSDHAGIELSLNW